MRGVQSSAGEERWVREEGCRAQSDESHHQMLRLQGPALRVSSGRHGGRSQVRVVDVNHFI